MDAKKERSIAESLRISAAQMREQADALERKADALDPAVLPSWGPKPIAAPEIPEEDVAHRDLAEVFANSLVIPEGKAVLAPSEAEATPPMVPELRTVPARKKDDGTGFPSLEVMAMLTIMSVLVLPATCSLIGDNVSRTTQTSSVSTQLTDITLAADALGIEGDVTDRVLDYRGDISAVTVEDGLVTIEVDRIGPEACQTLVKAAEGLNVGDHRPVIGLSIHGRPQDGRPRSVVLGACRDRNDVAVTLSPEAL